MPAYSNYGAALAGYIVERVSDEPFDDYVEHHIFAPLGMAHSTFAQPLPAALAGMMSKGYKQASQPAGKFELVSVAPAGSLSSHRRGHGPLHDRAPRTTAAGAARPEDRALMHAPANYADRRR